MSKGFSVTHYTTVVFDCDGVVLDSNSIKTEAFYQATLPFGEAAARAMIDYHIKYGGVSRYKKFAHFLEQIAPVHAEHQGPDLEEMLEAYACQVREGMQICNVAPGLEALRQKTPNARWMIVSGGDQDELLEVFTIRGISEWFEGGIFGSPETKDEILSRELAAANIQHPALFLGDTKYDYQVAKAAGLDFLFVSGWSEVQRWEEWVSRMRINSVTSLLELA